MKKTFPGLLITLIVLAGACIVPVELFGAHPAYLHALSDLRAARAHIERASGNRQRNWDERIAIREIEAAIREIKEASIDDGKNLNDHPPVDVRMDYPGRLRRGLELLRRAEKDCAQEEDNAYARGLKARALGHIREAIRFTKEGIAAF